MPKLLIARTEISIMGISSLLSTRKSCSSLQRNFSKTIAIGPKIEISLQLPRLITDSSTVPIVTVSVKSMHSFLKRTTYHKTTIRTADKPRHNSVSLGPLKNR